MTATESLKKELADLLDEGVKIYQGLGDESPKDFSFPFSYQDWFTKTVKIIGLLAKDRLPEFLAYYHADPKRKSLNYETYVIHDYLINIVPSSYHYSDFDPKAQTRKSVFNQLTILRSLQSRISGALSNIQGGLLAEIQDAELATAGQLLSVSTRASGALAGVILEGHLQKVAAAHGVTIKKAHPTISELNDPLKTAEIYDIPTWRKISFLADIRNLCSHKKTNEPTKEQVKEMIDGVSWVIKTIQ